MFSNGFWRSISLAIVTPSLVIVGAPYFLSRTTFRPFGPRVIFTASASASTPFLRERRASSSNRSCFAMGVHSFSQLQSVRLMPDAGAVWLRASGENARLGGRACLGPGLCPDDLRQHVLLGED